MSENSKENILKRLAKATLKKTALPYPDISDGKDIFYPASTDLVQQFKEQFCMLGGNFYLCSSEKELNNLMVKHCENTDEKLIFCADTRLINLLRNSGFDRTLNNSLNIPEASLCISSCLALIARTGSVLFSSEQAEGRSHGIAPDTQIVIAHKHQLVYNLAEALEKYSVMEESLPSMINLTSGASRTADIEKTLVMGAHGPKQLVLFLLDLS